MRTQKNRKKIGRLYILGAGASYSLTKKHSDIRKISPLDNQFCERILGINEKRFNRWANDAKDRIKNDWLYHDPFKNMGLETAIAQQLADLDFLKSIHSRRGGIRRDSSEFITDITHLMTYCLSKAKPHNKALLEKFADKIYPDGGDIGRHNNRVITFNYDTLLDDILLDRIEPNHLYFDSILTNRDDPKSTVNYKYPFLLKLHGSINWRCDKSEYIKIFNDSPSTKRSRTRTYDTKDCHFIDKIWTGKKIPKPTDDRFSLIIPPIPKKPVTSIAIFKYLWSYAYEYLHECNHLIVVGYSLPQSDTLAMSLFSKFKNRRIQKLTIIDPDNTIIARWMSLLKRNDVKTHHVSYFSDFEDYIQNGL